MQCNVTIKIIIVENKNYNKHEIQKKKIRHYVNVCGENVCKCHDNHVNFLKNLLG